MADATYRGTITRITGQGIFVIVPKLGSGVEYGPCLRISDVRSTEQGGGGDYWHGHGTVTRYVAGAQVLVSTINGVPDDLVVLGVLA